MAITDSMGDFGFSRPGPNKLTIDWHANCRAIREAFPHARLVVRSVEEAGDELIADFWRTCGLGVPPETAPERRANVSLGIIPYFAMRALFKHLPVRPRRKVYALLRRVNIRTRWDKSLFLRDEDRQRIRAFYHGAYVDLRDEFGVDLLS